MRILVTKQGSVIIQDIDSPTQFFNTITRNSPSSNFNRGFSSDHFKYNRKTNKKHLFSNYKSKIKNKLLSQSFRSNSTKTKQKKFNMPKSIEDGDFTKEEIEDAKLIKVKSKKVGFPKNFAEKYERDVIISKLGNSNNSFLPTLNSKNPGFTENNFTSGNDTLMNRDKFLTFRDIIPLNSVRKMEKEILNDRKNKEKEYRVTENNFRTYYDPETDIQKFKNVLKNGKLSTNKSSLIKYLKEKEFNPLLIKNLSDYDNLKISKVNKMCQIYFKNEDKDKLFNDLIKNKIKQQINGTKKEFQNCIHDLGKNINIIKEKVEKYERKVDDREKYRDQFNDFVAQYWLKRNLERLNKKSTPKPKYLKSFLDVDEDDIRKIK